MYSRSVLFVAALCVSGLYARPAVAQSDRPMFEAGGQLTLLRLTDGNRTNTGIGGRFSVDVRRWLSFVTQVDVFPSDDFEVDTPDPDPPPPNYDPPQITYQRRRILALFGANLGYRTDRWGVFAKINPGFTRLTNEGVDCVGAVCALTLLAIPEDRAEFALDFGGGVEFYPSRRTVTRFDIGDTMIQHRSTFVPPCATGECTSHNFTVRVGAGLKF
jgi:hypothetical protein